MANRSVLLKPGQEDALKEIVSKRGDCSVNSLIREAVDKLIAAEKKRK